VGAHPPTWNSDPVAVIQREAQRAGWYGEKPQRMQLSRELLAIAALVEAHRPEFDELLTGLEQTVDLQARQQARRARRARLRGSS
jgi:hypothetical protein